MPVAQPPVMSQKSASALFDLNRANEALECSISKVRVGEWELIRCAEMLHVDFFSCRQKRNRDMWGLRWYPLPITRGLPAGSA